MSLFGLLGSIGSTVIGVGSAQSQQYREQKFNAEQAQINRDFQREERLAVQDFNVDMWNRNNEYNSPASQMARARAAGINPNLVASGANGASASPVTSSPMSGSHASYSGSIADSLLTLNPEIAAMTANTLKTISEKNAIDIQNEYAPQLNDKALKKADAEIDDIGSRAGYTKEQTNQLKEMLPLLKGKTAKEIQEIRARIRNLFEEYKKIKADTAGVNYDNDLKEFKKQFRETFNVAPDSSLTDTVLQLLTSGEKGAELASSMLDTLFDVAMNQVRAVPNKILQGIKEIPGVTKDIYDKIVETLDDVGNSINSYWYGDK